MLNEGLARFHSRSHHFGTLIELIEFLDALRASYMSEYRAVYLEESAAYDQVFPEIAFQISGGTFKDLFVVDFLGRRRDSDTVIEVGSTQAAYASAASLDHKKLLVDFNHVSWDAVRFELSPFPEEITGFEAWFDKWIDLDGTRSVDGELGGFVIHSASLTGRHVDVDFGTAPAAAFLELLDLFSAENVSEVQVVTSRE